MVRWLGATLLLLAATLAAMPALAAGRVALVVGVSAYESVPSLDNAGKDAGVVAAALRASGFDVVERTKPQELTRRALIAALSDFRAKADGAEAAVIYFAGHGVEVAGTNWLLPMDVTAESPDDLEGTAIRASYLVNAARGAKMVRLVILDACRNNPFSQRRNWSTGNRAIGDRGLGRVLDRPDNVVVLLATQPGETASDGLGKANSPFAGALASALTMDGMQIAALPAMISRQMRQLAGVDQRPDQQGIFDEPAWMFRAPAAPNIAREQPRDFITPRLNASRTATDPARECDRLSGLEYDPERPAEAPVVRFDDILPALAKNACFEALAANPLNARAEVQLGLAHEKDGNFVAARGFYNEAVTLGSPTAHYLVGRLIEDGKGIAKDVKQARTWYEKGADRGSSHAMDRLGAMYQGGIGVKQDFAEARRWYERSAAKGNGAAMLHLGIIFDGGLGVAVDKSMARRWYEQAASKGDGVSAFILGAIYDGGLGVPQDKERATRFLEQGAALGSAEAMNALGYRFSEGSGGITDYVKARQWYEQASAKGSSLAVNGLGYMYQKGRGVPQDYAKARDYYEKSAAMGNSNALYNLGYLYRLGLGVIQDYSKAREFYEQAATKGNAGAMSELGYLHESGLGVVQDYAKARKYYEQAAENGNAVAMSNLGNLYVLGKGVTKDMATARRWYEQAAAKGNETAKTWLANHVQ